ncbi:carbohydrate ABC transporter permease [uncultured Ruminococcus sp.]|uniref:carbohydrate ABC transporter permease n=1 Tax=uncultured Ruminococcus sp. TaxID=165186 RepID=UPI0026292E12|nr:sugar ABC transporter permease [uncultured Ruminococcus sp.]
MKNNRKEEDTVSEKAEAPAGNKKKRRVISYQRRKSLYGYGFISLWLVGTVLFFLIPLGKSLWYSFCDVSVEPGALKTQCIGFRNYIEVLNEDPYYTDYLMETLLETLWKTPLILVFSLFIAVILNQKFRGRTLARAVFFLPVIIATGPVFRIINGDMESTGNSGAEQFSTMFSTDLVGELMQFLGIYGISDRMERVIGSISDNVFGIVWSSGIQILLFLAGLQNISKDVREAAQMEGATSWEYFWKIVFPSVGPFILANLIFTVIDSFTNPMNKVMNRIVDMKNQWEFGGASAMAWVYFAIVLAAIGVFAWITGKVIYYEDE